MNPTLNTLQQDALAQILNFLESDAQCLVLTGPAGSGKTTLIRALLDELQQNDHMFQLMATTGRAARILSNKTGYAAGTIHNRIYKRDNISLQKQSISVNYLINSERPVDSLLVVDEASMLAWDKNISTEQQPLAHRFGTGCLLDDLLTFAGLAGGSCPAGNKILFVGDTAQLCPVGLDKACALDAEYLHNEYGLKVCHVSLEGNCRQESGSLVVVHAERLRQLVDGRNADEMLWEPAGAGWRHLENDLAAAQFRKCFHRGNESIIITRTNRRALDLNIKVRTLLWEEFRAAPRCGDILAVSQNSFAYGLNNGDVVRLVGVQNRIEVPVFVKRTSNSSDRILLVFRKVRVAYYRDDMVRMETNCLILENGLDSPQAGISQLEKRALIQDFYRRCRKDNLDAEAVKQRFLTDEFLNALQVKYGYAITCHKAQGGEWDTVVLDVPTNAWSDPRWLYTAVTRARGEVRLLNAANLPGKVRQLTLQAGDGGG